MFSMLELGWVAGLLEGEGCFQHRRNGDLLIQVAMTDSDIIKRLQTILGFGSGGQSPLPSGKISYRWSSTHQANTAGLMMTLLPLMGKRRKAKIRECLKQWKAKPLPRSMWTHCKNGHELSGNNLKFTYEGKYEKRRCIECGKLRQRKYRAGLEAT